MLDIFTDILIFIQDNDSRLLTITLTIIICIFLWRNGPYSRIVESTRPVDSTVNSKVLNKGVWIYWIIMIIFILVCKYWFWWR